MIFRIILFVLCLPVLLLRGDALAQTAQYSKEDIPSWVKAYDFPSDAELVSPSEVNLQHLLIDIQRNWEEKATYCHFAIKILSQSGIKKLSNLQIDFDPSFHRVVMHSVRVFRDGEWLDRLTNARCHLIQRETKLDRNIYGGELTLVYFLEDIRKGDIVEYSYSLKGARSFFSSHYMDVFDMQWDFSINKLTYRLLGHPDLSFLIKPINTAIEPKIYDLSPSLREWSWEAYDTLPYTYEKDEPTWYNPRPHIEMSQYQSWEELARKVYPLYILPSDFAQRVAPEMQALVEHWKRDTVETSKRVLLALRFVQDQVRYVGLQDGMGAFQPVDPCLTFQRRFGDCKNKTFLLHALLQLMEVPSKPILVHTSLGKSLPDLLPSPAAFNHVVLQLEVDGTSYYVDPTYGFQGGSLQTNCFPAFEWGLLLSNDSKGLIPLPQVICESPIEIDTFYTLESEDIAYLKIRTVFHDSKADQFRSSLEWSGLKEIEGKSLSMMQKVYGAVTLDAPLEIVDDRENNIVTRIESYQLPTQQIGDKKVMKVFSYILRNYLDNQINSKRTAPYDIYYPLWVKESIHIDSPFSTWNKFEEDYKKEHESVFYSLSTRIDKKRATYKLELQHLQDHIPQASVHDYWAIVNEIELKAPSKMTIVSLPTSAKNIKFHPLISLLALIVWPLLYFLPRKRRPAQDLLTFQVIAFHKFYSVSTILSAICMSSDFTRIGYIVFGVILLNVTACCYIVRRRSAQFSQVLQGVLVIQTCWLLYYIFSLSGVLLVERILTCLVCLIYLGYSVLILKKISRLLFEEKKAASSSD